MGPDDPLFDSLEQLDREPLPDKPQTNAATQDDLTDNWNGSTAGIRFSESENSEE